MVFRGTVVCGGVPWGVEGYHGGNMECTEVMGSISLFLLQSLFCMPSPFVTC